MSPGSSRSSSAPVVSTVLSASMPAALQHRKGEPGNEIGYIKVIGRVDAELFQLHNACDDFNEAMFSEFQHRGLQTQSATVCVEKLELYDAFHALAVSLYVVSGVFLG